LSLASTTRAAEAVRIVRVPDGGTHPQVLLDSKGRINLLYVKGDPRGCDAFYVRSDDGGVTFSKPMRVNTHPKSVLIAGTVRGPHIAIGKGDRLHAAWMGSSAAEPRSGAIAPMLYTRLTDDGSAFEPERNVIASHPGLDGGGSVAADQDGNVYVVWHAPLDHNKKESEEGRHVWVARSKDGGKTFEAERRANKDVTGVCACCGIRAFAGHDGRLFIAYRTAKAGINRDMALLVSSDRGESFGAFATDPWQIGACMMSTSGSAQAGKGVLIAWETRQQLRLVRVAIDADKADALLSVPGEGKNRKHPRLASNAKGLVLVTWTEGTAWEKGGLVAWQVFDAELQPLVGRSGTATGLPAWGVAAPVALADGTFLVFY
jgi:hypothetical protein